jgi:hypothetical protein
MSWLPQYILFGNDNEFGIGTPAGESENLVSNFPLGHISADFGDVPRELNAQNWRTPRRRWVVSFTLVNVQSV